MKHLDSQAFATAGRDVHRVSLSALDLMQHGLARHAETFRSLVEREIAVRDRRHELGVDLSSVSRIRHGIAGVFANTRR